MPSKELAIAGLYDGIYIFYGQANFLLTAGLDHYWRRRAAAEAGRRAHGARRALDVCCGTGDFSLALLRAWKGELELTCADLSPAMLSRARLRVPGAFFVEAEAKALPFPDASFDLVTISFATRNLNLDKAALLAALGEFRRVLKPGGLFLDLETTVPRNPAVKLFFRAYVKTIIGLFNLLFPKSSRSYAFLGSTILSFYTAEVFSAVLAEAGFASVSAKVLFPGAVAVHTAYK